MAFYQKFEKKSTGEDIYPKLKLLKVHNLVS